MSEHHSVFMRTTVTLDRDVERLLRESMHRTRRTFKETLNAAIRQSLGSAPARIRVAAFVVQARPMGLRAGIDATGFNKLVDDLEADAFPAKVRREREA